jgi:hypothetical protein
MIKIVHRQCAVVKCNNYFGTEEVYIKIEKSILSTLSTDVG